MHNVSDSADTLVMASNLSLLLGEKPNQPSSSFKFPKTKFGKEEKKRSVQSNWFQSWTWLHYQESSDELFCFLCVKAYQQKKIHNTKTEQTFISTGFSDWKKATEKFKKHESSQCHKESLEQIIVLPSTSKDIGEMFSSQHAAEKEKSRECLLKVIQSLKYLSRQSIALRKGSDETDSNFIQLLKLQAESDPGLSNWLEKKRGTFCSNEIQNEILKVMSQHIQREVAANIRSADFFTLMADETPDLQNKEQCVICLRWVDNEFEVHEDLIGLYNIESTASDSLVAMLNDVMIRMNLSLVKCRGQCYDGASNMSGNKNGVAKQIREIEPRALYTHCYGHVLNLAVKDSVDENKLLKDALDMAHEIVKVIKNSPKKEAIFKRKQIEDEVNSDIPQIGIRKMCPTRWTVRADALDSILQNYDTIMESLEDYISEEKDSGKKAKLMGILSCMEKFDFFFGLHLGNLLLRHSDNLSRTLQSSELSAAGGQEIAKQVVLTLNDMENNEKFKLFWEKVKNDAKNKNVGEAVLPRKRRVPAKLKDFFQPDARDEPVTVAEHYKQFYLDAIDKITSCINNRFDQEGYQVYKHLENLIVLTAEGGEFHKELDYVTEFYGNDLTDICWRHSC